MNEQRHGDPGAETHTVLITGVDGIPLGVLDVGHANSEASALAVEIVEASTNHVSTESILEIVDRAFPPSRERTADEEVLAIAVLELLKTAVLRIADGGEH